MIETGGKLDYLLTFILLLFWFIYKGIYVKQNRLQLDAHKDLYWIKCFSLIVLYAIIEGLRYGRGRDYVWYKYQYENVLNPVVEQEYLFMLLNKGLAYLDFPYWGIFVVYAIIWIVLSLFFLSKYKYNANWLFVLFFLATVGHTESLIRQFLAIAFLLPFINLLIERKYKSCFCCGIIAIFIHSSSVITIFLYVTIYWLLKKPINLFISISAYLFFSYVWDISKINIITDYVAMIDLGTNRLASYTENADRWFSDEAINAEEFARGGLAKLSATIFEISTIILGKKSIEQLPHKYRKSAIFFYNTFIIGAICYQAVFTLEIMRRIFDPLYIFWSMVVANILFCYPFKKVDNLNLFCLKALILIYVISYFVIKNRLLISSQMFVWDVGNYK